MNDEDQMINACKSNLKKSETSVKQSGKVVSHKTILPQADVSSLRQVEAEGVEVSSATAPRPQHCCATCAFKLFSQTRMLFKCTGSYQSDII